MSDEWQIATIEKIADKVGMGPFGSSIKVETFVDEGIPIISGQHITGTRLVDAEHNYITIEHAERLKNANVYRGDVIFTHAGNIGQVAYIPETSRYERYVISQRQFYMRCDRSKVIPEFITYFFKSPEGQHKLLANTSSSGVPSIAQPVSYLKTIDVPVPPLPEQRAIAAILGALDDKIELNRQMNKTLEAMAQALFKSWFVDFEPFREQGMQNSLLGEIPVGWKVEPLGDHFEVVRGLSHRGEYLSDNGMPLHNLNSVYEGGGYKYEGIKFYQGEYQDRHTVVPGDVIVTNTEQGFDFLLIGYPAIVPDCFGPVGLFSHHLFRLRVLDGSPLTTHYIYLLLKNRAYHGVVAGYTNGTTINMLQRGDLSRLPIMIPSKEISARFDKLVDPLLSKIKQIHDESELLSGLRDTLLPKLLSGEIRVKDAEKFVEEAV